MAFLSLGHINSVTIFIAELLFNIDIKTEVLYFFHLYNYKVGLEIDVQKGCMKLKSPVY